MIKRLKINDLGPIKEANINFGNITIICGKNSVGKTYLSYAQYLLTNIFFQSFRASIKCPTLDHYLKGALSDDISKFIFSLNIDEIHINKQKIISELNSTKTAVFLANSLELTGEKIPTIVAEIDNNFVDKITKGSGEVTAINGDQTIVIKKSPSDSHFTIDFTKNIAFTEKSKKQIDEVVDMIAYFICTICLSHSQFAITSERTGISLFYNDLDSSLRKAFVEFGFESDIAKQNVFNSKYIKPIEDNISTIRSLSNRHVHFYQRNRITSKNAKKINDTIDILRDLLGGKYKAEDKIIKYIPANADNIIVSLKSSSGAARSMLLLDHFVTRLQERNGMLIIDEPEMNLHLDNQRKMAHLLAALSNNGVKVVVTTHSDHFVREINNLIMLSSSKIDYKTRMELLKKANIKEISILKPEDVTTVVIEAETGKTKEMSVSEFGIDLKLFNDEIIKSIDISNDISMAIHEGC
ncbi:AAA family ATPase [Aeromonas veronii]|uniref:AAA family ATPase n=1 Tax=Aeromonas veronii TaxID=654 RepID=UPI001F3DFB84|nr:AAA family ATPase [Aeromonas veronii]MCF5761535.1 AAA family ATPase [Aeromonas veronii]